MSGNSRQRDTVAAVVRCKLRPPLCSSLEPLRTSAFLRHDKQVTLYHAGRLMPRKWWETRQIGNFDTRGNVFMTFRASCEPHMQSDASLHDLDRVASSSIEDLHDRLFNEWSSV